MRKDRVQKMLAELYCVADAVMALDEATKAGKERDAGANFYPHSPKETGALRRASLDLTRALAEMRKSDYTK